MKRMWLYQVVLFVGVASVGLLVGSGGCIPPPTVDPNDPNTDPNFVNADLVRGGLMYDKWWKIVTGATEPTTDHPLWASNPDPNNTRSGSATWRCKECHGWDYKGSSGVYASGSHATGVKGIFGTTKTFRQIFDLIKTTHGFGAVLSDADIWDLVKFVLQGVIDTSTVINPGSFNGSATTGKTLYDNGIGTNFACALCHGADGKTLLFDGGTVTLGGLADDNPWEVLHKIRFGQPGEAMPSSIAGGGTLQNANDVGAYCQTLPDTP